MLATQLALSLVGLVRCFFRSNNTEQVKEKYGNEYGYGYGKKIIFQVRVRNGYGCFPKSWYGRRNGYGSFYAPGST